MEANVLIMVGVALGCCFVTWVAGARYGFERGYEEGAIEGCLQTVRQLHEQGMLRDEVEGEDDEF